MSSLTTSRFFINSKDGKLATKRRSRNLGRGFPMRVAVLQAIFLLLLSRNGVGVAADETLSKPTNKPSKEFDEHLVGNKAADEAKLEIPDDFGMPSYQTESPTAAPPPSATPSSEPTYTPSELPSFVPSTRPTVFPTVTPMPTDKPSFAPTNEPSSSPSELPSSTPSLSCHDVAAYRSPINNFTCEDHAGTDCTQWRFIGLNMTDLQELIEQCPISCDVPCGYFTTLDTNISFIISNVPRLIDDFMSRQPLEEATRVYLTEYILKTSPITRFALTHVELLFQEQLNSTLSSRIDGSLRGRRVLQNITTAEGEHIHLQVKLNLQGFNIYPIRIVLTDLLLAGIDSPEYTAELRHADSFYANATASSAAQAKPPVVNKTPPSEPSRTISSVLAIVIGTVAASIALFGAVLFVKHGRLRRGCNKQRAPLDAEAPHRSTRSIRGNVFSFDLSPASSTGVGRGRLLAVYSGDSRDSTKSPSSGEGGTESPQMSTDEHPLTGVIPPMLVIDNIEQAEQVTSMRSLPEVINAQNNKAVVPTKRMEASAKFIEALNNCQTGKQNSSSTFSEFLYSISSLESGTTSDPSQLVSPAHRALAVVLSGDRSVADDTSVSSTPVKGSDLNLDVPPRRTLSSGQLADEIDVDQVLDEFMKTKAWEYNGQTDDTSSEEEVSPSHRVVKSASYDHSPQKSPHSMSDAMTVVRQNSKRQLARKESKSRSSSRSSNVSPTHRRTHSKNGSRSSQSSGELFGTDGETLYVYEASHRGYLGLAIEPCRRGTRIQAVKDYSPLFGLVEPGDRIVEVDGVETSYKTTAGVAELLKRKKGRNRKIRITVTRKNTEMAGIPALPISMTRSRSKSFGSIPPHVPIAGNPMDYSGLTTVTDLDTSYAEIPTPSTEEEPEELPFHFIGAVAYEEPDYESFSDSGL